MFRQVSLVRHLLIIVLANKNKVQTDGTAPNSKQNKGKIDSSLIYSIEIEFSSILTAPFSISIEIYLVIIFSFTTTKQAIMSSSIQPSSIHLLLEARKWKDAEALLNSDPSTAFEIGSSFKALPLTVALMNHPPVWIVDSLIDANPVAVRSKNEYGMLPIRVAIRGACSTDVIKALIRENPESVKCFGVSGKTCLHLACLYGFSVEVVEEIIRKWPEAAQWRDRDGWHPLHIACVKGDSDIIQTLLDAYPNAAAMPDSPEHQLPLHLAVLHNAPIKTLKKIYEAYPDAVKLPTKTHGWTPLHLACRKCAPNEVIRFLLDCYPDGVKVKALFHLSSFLHNHQIYTLLSFVNVLALDL